MSMRDTRRDENAAIAAVQRSMNSSARRELGWSLLGLSWIASISKATKTYAVRVSNEDV